MNICSTGTSNERRPLAVTVKVASQLSGLGNTKLYELIKDGRLRTVTVDRRRLVLFSGLEELLAPAEHA
jgi:excisionase family DNA binding protein